MSKWNYFCSSEQVQTTSQLKDQKLSETIDKTINKLMLKNLEELMKPPVKRHIEVTHVVTTPLDDKIIVTVVSRGTIED